MVSEKIIRVGHPALFSFILLFGIVNLAISASLVKFYNDNGYVNKSYRDRIRITLVASILAVAFGLYLMIGTLVAAQSVIFGIFVHVILLAIAFILFIIGISSLTALTTKVSCGDVTWDRCRIVKGLVGVGWVETILLFVALVLIFGLGVKSRSGAGMRRSTLGDA